VVGDDGTPSIDSGRSGWGAQMPTDGASGCECRRSKMITAMAMATAAIPPTTPPAIAPAFELPPPDMGNPVAVEEDIG
jgi:hypothetical protein